MQLKLLGCIDVIQFLETVWLKRVSPFLLALMDSEISDALLGINGEQQRTRKDVDAVRQRMRRMRQSGAQDNSQIGSFSKLVVLTWKAVLDAFQARQSARRRSTRSVGSVGRRTRLSVIFTSFWGVDPLVVNFENQRNR